MKSQKKFDSVCKKRVSYILVTKNRAKHLDLALRRYRKLVQSQDELIIIDGASVDNTLKVINKYSDFIDILISEPDVSATNAFNKGILLARGKYIKNLNDDDVIYPEAMKKALAVLEKHVEVDVLVCGGTKQFEGKYNIVHLPPGVNYGKSTEDVFKYGACGVGFIIRRRSLALGLISNSLRSDVHFILESIINGLNVKFCRIKLFNHPIYPHSTIIKKQREIEDETNKLIKQYCSKEFYLQYRLSRFLGKNPANLERLYKIIPTLRVLLLPFKIPYQKILSATSFRKSPERTKDDYVWDAGFS